MGAILGVQTQFSESDPGFILETTLGVGWCRKRSRSLKNNGARSYFIKEGE